MSLFSRKVGFPGIALQADGSIDFTLTPEESRVTDAALAEFKDYLVLKKYSDRIRNGTIAVALSRYAKDLIFAHQSELANADGRLSRDLETVVAKAVAAVWKASSLSPLPIFTFHHAFYLGMLGRAEEAKRLYATFIKQQAAFRPDQVDQYLTNSEGFDVQSAISIATDEISA
jgi:hypothetical protein